MEFEQLIEYITGDPDEATTTAVLEWISASEENRKEFYRLKNIYALSQSGSRVTELRSDYFKVKEKLDFGSGESPVRWLKELLKYAAVVVFTLISVYFIGQFRKSEIPREYVSAYHQLTVPLGQISEFIFADGTRVWLNSGTTLRFPDNPQDSLREVFLEGEAYFDVSKIKKRPFIVHTGPMDIRVLGTAFNVQCYPDMDKSETTLVEGSLEIQNHKQELLAMLKPGEQLKFSRSTLSRSLSRVDTAPYKAWRDGKLIFRDKSLGEIAGSLERWYNVRIIFSDEKIKNYRFTGTILKHKPFDQILQAIRLTTPIRYQIRVHAESSNEVTLYSRE